jgi:predicted Zn-dependent peptidase
VVGGKVDTPRTAEVLARMLAELAAIRAGGGTFEVDFVRARRRALAGALAYIGGASATANAIERMAARGLPLDHGADLAAQIARLTPAQVRAIAAADLAADRMVVQVAGKAAAVDAAFARVGATPE